MTEIRDIGRAHEDLQLFWAELQTRQLPAGVSRYVLGESVRGEQRQADMFAQGLSQALWAESPHNYEPALAIDVFPIAGGIVSGDPAHYSEIEATADDLGLSSGASWGDHPHVELVEWRDLAVRLPLTNGPSPLASAGIGAGLAALALALGALIWSLAR